MLCRPTSWHKTEPAELALEAVEVAVPVTISAHQPRAADVIEDFDALGHLNRKWKLRYPGRTRLGVGQRRRNEP